MASAYLTRLYQGGVDCWFGVLALGRLDVAEIIRSVRIASKLRPFPVATCQASERAAINGPSITAEGVCTRTVGSGAGSVHTQSARRG